MIENKNRVYSMYLNKSVRTSFQRSQPYPLLASLYLPFLHISTKKSTLSLTRITSLAIFTRCHKEFGLTLD